jgi:ABC-type polysaccharide/polyol phosphate transport system ATPase subunit
MSSQLTTDPAICLKGVSVHYRVPRGRRRSLKNLIVQLGRTSQGYDDFTALQGVDLSIAPGEVVGVIGRNGAGKSTLLAVVSRVLKPTMGDVSVHGRIAPLLALGAGFEPELSGRENIFLNAALLGFCKPDVFRLYNSIVSFAELQDFIEAPLKTYSSGMQMRLGFAIATAADADILLVDEVLAVGDERFRKKCEDRIDSFRDRRMTILLVSHDMKAVQELCTRAIWLNHGRIVADGKPQVIVQQYRDFMASNSNHA